MKSKTPKIISDIIATISCISLAFIFFTSFWFWISFEFLAATLVTFGCGGEWWLHHHPSGRKKKEKDLHHALESKFIEMVVIGLIMELVSLGHSVHEGVKLENKVSEANERVSTNELALAVLNSNNLVLKKLVLESSNRLVETESFAARIRMKLITPRDWSFDDIKFVADLTGRPKGAVAIFITSGNKSDSILALKIEESSKLAGWTVIPSTSIPDELLLKMPTLSMGNILITRKTLDLDDFKTQWVEHPATNSDGSTSMTNLWRMDTPRRAFKVALGDSGVWVGQEMTNTNLPDNEMQLILGVEQW